MKRKAVLLLAFVVVFLSVMTPRPVAGDHVCKCLDFGAMSCKLYNDDGDYVGWILYPNHPSCQ